MSTTANNTAESIKWTKVEVDAFVAVMVEEVKKGNKTTSTFNKTGWNSIKSKLESQFGRPFTNLQLRKKMNKLRNDYGSFKRLVETSEFNWNKDIRACEVTDESVWDRHIKENPSWLKFKRNGLPQWPELQIIFSDSYASGVGAVSNVEEHNIFQDMPDLDADADGTQLSPGVGSSNTEHLNKGIATHRLDRKSSGKRKKRMSIESGDMSTESGDISTELGDAIIELCMLNCAILDFCDSRFAGSSCSPVGGEDFSVGRCITILNSMTELDKEMYMKAVMKVMENATWREAFVSVPAEKKMWLLEALD